MIGLWVLAVFFVFSSECDHVRGQDSSLKLNSPSSTVAPNRIAPNTVAPDRIAPNMAEPGRIGSNRIPSNAVPSSTAQYTLNPDGSLPVRPGALVNPRSASQRQQDLQQQVGPIQQVAANGLSQGTVGGQSRNPILIPDNIPNTGTPGGGPQSGRLPAPQPQRPEQTIPKNGQPFPQLTPEQLTELNRFLEQWEIQSGKIKRFEAEFRCFQYGGNLLADRSSSDSNTPDHLTYGSIRYIAPNKGVFHVEGEIIDNKKEEGRRQQKFLATDKSIFDYDFDTKKIIEYRIPLEQQGGGILKGGPLPFVFGAKAEDLKKRYYLHLITPEKAIGKEIRLEVYPRWQEDADEFRCVQLIVDARTFVPLGLIKYAVNGKERTTYKFEPKSIRINNNMDKIRDFFREHFASDTPLGWTKEVQDIPAQPESNAGASQQPGGLVPAKENIDFNYAPPAGPIANPQPIAPPLDVQPPPLQPMPMPIQPQPTPPAAAPPEVPLYTPPPQSRPEF